MKTSVERARRLIARPGAWIDAVVADRTYGLRVGPDRRFRATATIDETTFRGLIEDPGLRRRPDGGWEARDAPSPARPVTFGAPGMILGDRVLLEADGRQRRIRANLGHSPIQWLARRRDAQGRPFLTPAEAAAGERLAHEAEIALSGPSLTMRWDALPRAGGGSAARVEPGDRALNAAGRVRRALAACPPETRAVLDHICIRGQTLQLAEQACGMRRRTGREALRRGLTALARHYRVG